MDTTATPATKQARLDAIFRPRSIAVIGASRNPESMSGMLFRNLSRSFRGPVIPVNPHADEIDGRPTVGTLGAIDESIDLAFVAVPLRCVDDAIEQCIEKPVRGVVLITAGFSEVGPAGRIHQQRIAERLQTAGIRMLGPNCMGVLNRSSDVNLNGTFNPFYPPPGNVAVATQSGALGYVFPDYIRQWNVGISHFASLGNKAIAGENDLLEYWRDDPDTDVIQLYLESFQAPRRFREIAREVSRRKPIVLLKSGRTSAGQRAAGSHTAALASSDRAVDALAKQAGVIRCNDLHELFATTALLSHQPLPRGPRVAVLTNAGGPAVLCVDALESQGLCVPPLSKRSQQRLSRFLRPETAKSNPIDLIGSTDPSEFQRCLEVILEEDDFDAAIVMYVPRLAGTSNSIADVIFATAKERAGARTIVSVFMESHAQPPGLQGDGYRIPSFQYPESAAAALASAFSLTQWRQRHAQPAATVESHDSELRQQVGADVWNDGWLSPNLAFDVLRKCGLHVPEYQTVNRARDALAAFEAIGGPIAMKVIAADVLHKSNASGVVLNLDSAELVRHAFGELVGRFPAREGILVQRMAPTGIETIVGVYRDPQFGHLIGFGAGGTLVELVDDMAFRIVPTDVIDADELIAETRASRLLQGFRGEQPHDVQAVRNVLLQLSSLVTACPEIVEIDLNPMIVHPIGVTVVDARIRVQREVSANPRRTDQIEEVC